MIFHACMAVVSCPYEPLWSFGLCRGFGAFWRRDDAKACKREWVREIGWKRLMGNICRDGAGVVGCA